MMPSPLQGGFYCLQVVFPLVYRMSLFLFYLKPVQPSYRLTKPSLSRGLTEPQLKPVLSLTRNALNVLKVVSHRQRGLETWAQHALLAHAVE